MNGWDFKEFNACSYLENFQDPNLVFSSNPRTSFGKFFFLKSILMDTTKYHNIFTTK